MEKIDALVKRATSYLKRTWDVDDYPLRYVEQASEDEPVPRWRVDVAGWPVMGGLGPTRGDAKDHLQARLEEYLRSHGRLPRPGTEVPFVIESDTEIRKHWATVRTFVAAVVGQNPDAIWVSDSICLWHFCDGDERQLAKYQAATLERFGVDISDIEDGNLVEIATRIEARWPIENDPGSAAL